MHPCVYLWGPIGIAVLWAGVEILQLSFVHIENRYVLPALTGRRLVTLCALPLLLVKPAAVLGSWLQMLHAHLRPSPCGKCRSVDDFGGTTFGLGELVSNIKTTFSPFERQPATPIEM